MNKGFVPISNKLRRIILLTSSAVLLLMGTCFLVYEYITYKESTVRQITTTSKIIAANSSAALAFQNEKDAGEILSSLINERRLVAAALYDNSGQLFAVFPARAKVPGKLPPFVTAGFEYEQGYLHGYQTVTERTKHQGILYLKWDTKALTDRMLLYTTIALITIAIAFLLAYFLSKKLQKSITDPIVALTRNASSVSDKHDYSVRAERTTDDEIGVLTDAFNNMLKQIEEQNSQILRFNHELEQRVAERTMQLENANQKLVQQNDFVETIIDSSVHVIAVLDAQLRFTRMNAACEKMYNLKEADVLGREYTELFPQAVGAENYKNILRGLKGEMVHSTVTSSAILPGFFENYFIPLRNEHEVYGLLIISHDITELKEANEKLQRINADLERSNEYLEQFAYVASHDLQEPLRKIQTFAEMAQRSIENPAAIQRHLSKVRSSANRMANLITDVLNYSKLSVKDDRKTEINLNQIVDNIRNDFELLLLEKNGIIHSEELPGINGIPLQIHQLFQNLISNALKFSSVNPVVRIVPGVCKYSELPANSIENRSAEYLQLRFEDNGIGFDQGYADKIFTIFQRLHAKGEYEGTGIGLAICKKVIENHNGHITAKGEPGKGSVFTVYLPLN